MAKATIFFLDLKTGRVRHSRRRKAVATEERRIKAIRDQPCPFEEGMVVYWIVEDGCQ
ncbi:unnamed protein product [Brassica rapa subsp. narinosa]|uniref:Uncharacterized protein n=1 Tax=Brassica campestris TaxID=3711 RepID=A0A3P6BDH6_BRACM|nr:unnamed protein product [Brassica rapa]VDC95940.1 unnamed protein product [Brassica rapa]